MYNLGLQLNMKTIENPKSERRIKADAILATEKGVVSLIEAIRHTRQELAEKTLQMGIVATDGDRDIHENYQFRDLNLEIQGPIPRKILDLEAQLQRVVIGDGMGNFNRQFSARIETPGDDPEVRTIKLVGPIEINYIGHTGPNSELYISYESSLGSVLLHADLVPGKTLEFETHNGPGKVTIERA